MDDLRRFPAPWSMHEDDGGFTVRDASGFMVAGVPHREDLHTRNYQYARDHLSREEARKIAKAISRLPDLLRQPQY